ncbi:MAG: aldehyde ferredoxin oxidoreductase family protein [archaeon]|nr:aldehyde ferredoxin oxidoreductase family protein [archaeon]
MNQNNVLYIDLERKSFHVKNRSELFNEWLGGVGVALQLYKEEAVKGADPFDPGNSIVFATGPLTDFYPLASKVVAVFKSPLTGNYGESHAGGRSATAIRSAGYEAIVIKGVSDRPIYLVISEKGVQFRDAATLWGMRSTYTVGRVLREALPGAGLRTIMRIGRAGEKLVRYACVVTETYRHFGRMGLGAVFGSKKLKALMVHGKSSIRVPQIKVYRDAYDEIYGLAVRSDSMKKYHELGTAMNVLPMNALGALPTRNLSEARFEGAEKISGEDLATNKLGRRVACSHCPVACIHLATIRDPYPDEPYFYKTTFVSYDYEPLYSLGSMLGISDINNLLKLMDEVEVGGLDAISTGVALAWATEAYKRGLVKLNDVLLDLDWGRADAYREAVKLITDQPNEFYKALAMGVDYTSKIYGGREFALSFGGNEMPGYHTGPAVYIGYLIGSRHSHLDGAGYSIDQKMKDLSPEELVDKLIEEECWRQILSSLVVCYFARKIYEPSIVKKALNALGYEFDEERLKELGRRIYEEKQALKASEGFKPTELKIPERIFEVQTFHGLIDKNYIKAALEYYSKIFNKIMEKTF